MASATVAMAVERSREASPIPAEAWAEALTLRCQLTVDMPMPGFKVADVLRLRREAVIDAHWRVGTDVPLRLNGRLVARGEFEVAGNHLALRLTELAGGGRERP